MAGLSAVRRDLMTAAPTVGQSVGLMVGLMVVHLAGKWARWLVD